MSWGTPKRTRRMSSGPFDSKAIGSRVKLQSGDHSGEEGVIVAAYREPTFSQMVPWVIEYRVELDSGEKVYIRREWVRKVKAKPTVEESITEAWESYKATGEVSVLSEKIGEECTRCHVPLTHDNVSRHSDEICADCDADMYEPHYDYEDNSDVVSRSEYE